MESGDIPILDRITGSQAAVLSGHTEEVNCLTFSLDGTLLVSGGNDMTVKLWDMQTGGVINTFHGHTDDVWSVSISVDSTVVASGSDDNTIHLWNVQTRECLDRVVVSWPAESESIVDEPCERLHDEGSVDGVNGIKEVWIACGWVCKMKVDGERRYRPHQAPAGKIKPLWRKLRH